MFEEAPPTTTARRGRAAAPAVSPAVVAAALEDVEVRRSRRRVRTVTAFRDGGRMVVAIPARFTRAQEREWVQRMVTRLVTQEERRRPSDGQLAARAAALSTRYLGGRARPTTVRWSSQQGRRWGSCTPADGSIRISTRVRGMPRWVLDYVLLHELAHLLHGDHGPEFWALLDAYPRTERARGFLDGVGFATDTGAGEEGQDADDGGGLDDGDLDDGALDDGALDDGALDDGDVDAGEDVDDEVDRVEDLTDGSEDDDIV